MTPRFVIRTILMMASIGMCALGKAAFALTLTIGVDLSGSNPLLTHQNFAHGASKRLTTKITALKTGDTVRLITFGARGDAQNLINHEIVIGRRTRPTKVAKQVSQFVNGLPKQAAQYSQSSTNLVAWLEFTSGFQCENGGQVFVITDGLESSSLVNGKDFLEGKAHLPEADVDLSGCEVTFYGLGAGWPPHSVKHVRNAWRDWFSQAGSKFEAIIP